ncbi:MAG TPA: hypothetical protein VNH18_31805 [Bryobacteraceae bacterium]|nr:hypothetical protein [Bryobacteraceae bacterium]
MIFRSTSIRNTAIAGILSLRLLAGVKTLRADPHTPQSWFTHIFFVAPGSGAPNDFVVAGPFDSEGACRAFIDENDIPSFHNSEVTVFPICRPKP